YDKFGYAVCLPDVWLDVKTRDARRATPTLNARPYTPDDLPAVLEIYAANSADLTGSIVRTETTKWFSHGSWWDAGSEPFVFTDASGTVVAYAARDLSNDAVYVTEVGANRLEHYSDIVRWAADRAVELVVEKITFFVPPDSLFSAYMAQFGAEQRVQFPR